MPDPKPTPDTVTVASQSIELLLTGKPDVKYKWDSGSIRPSLVTFTYRQEGIHAHLFGVWVREDGQLADAPCDQLYRVDDTDWPDWLAALAAAHDRRSAVPSAPAARAAILREAVERLRQVPFTNVLTDLRRMADEAEYVATPCSFGACEPGGEPCTTHERLMAHAEGEHELCGPECPAVQQPKGA